MKRIILSLIFVLALVAENFPQGTKILSFNFLSASFDELVKFDIYAKLPIRDEKARFDVLFTKLIQDTTVKSLIVLKLDRNESRKKQLKRLMKIAEHFDFRKVDKTKYTFAVFNEEKEETTIFWVEPLDVNLEGLLLGESPNYKLIKAEEFKQKINELFPKK